MQDPKRLADEGDAFEQALLDSARMDIGSALAESNCVSLLERAPDPAALPHAALASKKLMLIVGAGIATSVALVAWWLPSRQEPRPAAPASAKVALAPHRATALLSSEAGVPAPAARTAPATPPPATIEALDTARKPAALPARASARGLAEEVALLQSVRHTLAAGDPGAALIALDRHAREFKSGLLRLEAAVLRVQVLLALGDTLAAHGHADRFLATHPEGPHAKRVRNLLQSAEHP